MDDLIETPTVEAYAALKQHERAAAARAIVRNAKIIESQAAALDAAQRAARQVRAQMIAAAKVQARAAARAEVEQIYADTYTAERILAFETHPRTPAAHGDIRACAAESHQWDIDHPRRGRGKTHA